MNYEDEGKLVDVVQPYLEQRGWQPAGGEEGRWVDHSYTNEHGTLGMDFLQASPPGVGFTFETDDKQVRLLIEFDDVLPVLETISQAQKDLSDETWPSFIARLLGRAKRIIRVAEDEDEDDEDEEITTPDQGAAALRENDWEYIEDDDT